MKKPSVLDVAVSSNGNSHLDKAREAGSVSDVDLKPKSAFGIRHLQCVLIFFGLAVAYALRVNMSVAIVAMTDRTTNSNFDAYAWDEKTKSMVLSSFFWGYVLTQIPGGYLCQKFGAKYVLFVGVGVASALGALTPICASAGNWQLICVLRFIQGLCQGCLYPGTHSILSNWVPAEERAGLGTFCYSGTQFGSVAMLAVSGFIASSSKGWPGIFYISGTAGLLWTALWYYFAASTPSDHKKMSNQERRLIEDSLGHKSGTESAQLSIPWKSMITSVPFLSLLVVHATHTWGFWTLLTEIPSYMNSVLQFDIKSNALLSALPYFVMMVLSFAFVVLAEYLNKKRIFSTAASRKIFNTIGHWIPAISLIALGYVKSDERNLAIALLTLTVGINSAAYLGFQMNHIDLSPNFASTMMGVTNFAANIMSVCGPLAVGFLVTDQEYPWTEKTKSLILSSFFWGYVVTQIPAGQIAQRYGAKLVVLYGILICAVLNILTPWCARMGDWPLICSFRVIQGLCQGCIFPSTHTLLSKWAPVEERGKLGTFSYAGTQFGTALMLALSGVLASSAMGWPSIFYFSGAVGILWAVLWFFFASSSPSENRFISEEERRYIETSLGQAEGEKKSKLPTPWKDILTSVPFLVLLCSHCANNWGFWTLLTEIPTYMKNILGMDIKKNALLSALPYLAMCLLSFFFAFLSEVINRRRCMSLPFSRKFFNSIGLWIPMIGLIGLGYIDGGNVTLAIVLLTLTVGINSACYLGFQVNHIDLSPNFAGTLMGMTNCAANIMSIIAPLTVGFIVHDEKDPTQWRIIFFIAAGFFLVGNLLFVVFGKTETQYWNEPKASEKKKEVNTQNPVYMESQN